MIDPNAIPGMIELCERENLVALATAADLSGNKAIVEFGTFFGRSTACLLNGALSNPSRSPESPCVIAYDALGCAEESSFAPYVLEFAHRAGLADLLEKASDRISFRNVTQRYLRDYGDALHLIERDLHESEWCGRSIALMHIDSPKSYEDLKPILFRFLPFASEGALIIFQDFFYQWSAGLIAAAQAIVETGALEYLYGRASSMIAQIKRPLTNSEIAEIDLTVRTDTPGLVARAKASVQGLDILRPEEFLPRLELARAQHLWKEKDYPAATSAIVAGMFSGPELQSAVVADFIELLSFGFDPTTPPKRAT